MALPPVGSSISLSDIQSEYGGSNPISLSEYYGKGNAPSSGAITMSADFGGTSNAPPPPQTFTGAGTSNITIADNVRAIGVQVVGAGGGGASAGGMFSLLVVVAALVVTSLLTSMSVVEKLFPLFVVLEEVEA